MKELRNSILCIALVIATLSLSILMVKPSCAQSTEPSPPKFSIQTPNASTIQLVIENQAFTNSSSVNSLVYYFRVKAHNSDTWMMDGDYTLQSNSGITIISIAPESGLGAFLSTPMFQNCTMLDFQVQAVTGFYSVTWQPGYMPGMPTQFQSGNGYWDITFNPAESSDWSSTQIVAMPVSSNSPSSALVPTQVPFSASNPTANSTNDSTSMPNQNENTTKTSSISAIPEFLWLVILPLSLSIFSIAVILRHRKIIHVKKETSCQCSKSGTRCSKSRTKSHLLTFI